MAQQKSNQDTNLNMRVTKTMELMVRQEEKKPRYFFIRRVPFRRVQREWTHPGDEQYEKLLIEQGFISASLLKEPVSEDLATDIRELDQHLLPHFWRVNQEAKYFQNRYYQYQWVFILAAFLTTALAAVNVFMYAQGWQDGVDTGTFLGTIKWTEILGFLTAVISGTAATVSFLDANQTPQSRWFKARAQAESLRSLYFLFVARQNPFNLETSRARVQKLRRKVIDVLVDSPGADQMAAVATSGSFKAAPPAKPAGGSASSVTDSTDSSDDSDT